MSDRTAIVGDGQMGLVLAQFLAEHGRPVRLTGPFPDAMAALAATRTSDRLPGFVLPEAVAVDSDPAAALEDAALVVNAIPTQFIRGVWSRLAGRVAAETVVASVSKGFETETLRRPSEVLAEAGRIVQPIVKLSGPTIASELALRLPATMVAASTDARCAAAVQRTFSGRWLRIYTNPDPIGVEIAGAVKNVIALAAGMVDGLGAGCNAKSALLARGLAEIVRLGAALGARAETFFGIAGVGDLATTCYSPHGRNRTCGERLARGESLREIVASTRSVIEGVDTARAVARLARAQGVEMPIAEAVAAILFDGLAPTDAIALLMGRELKGEQVG